MAKPHLWDRAKERLWRQRLARWRKSGLSGRDFCAREGLSEPSFYAWCRTLRQRDQAGTQAARPAARAATAGRRPPRRATPRPAAVVLPVRLCPEPRAPAPAPAPVEAPALEVVLPRGRVVRVRPGFAADTLRQLLALLEEGGASC